MPTRSADATLKGYYYQLDTSILALLALQNPTDTVVIEGIEDIDIATSTAISAVQCKYLSKPNFTNSAVREPIILMLDHHLSDPQLISKYILYAHFENGIPGSEPAIDLNKLKSILTYSAKTGKQPHHVEKNIDDHSLQSFLDKFKFQYGMEFDVQRKTVLQRLQSYYGCTVEEADIHFYNNALRFVFDKAVLRDINDRTITKSSFVQGIDGRKKVYTHWYIAQQSMDDYLKHTKKMLIGADIHKLNQDKTIVIGTSVLQADNRALSFVSFIESLIFKYYRMSYVLRGVRPLTLVLDCSPAELLNFKTSLIQQGIIFNDGYESISFSSEFFNRPPFITLSKNRQKLSSSSYSIRIISLDTFIASSSSITQSRTYVLFNPSQDMHSHIPTGVGYHEFHYFRNLNDIKQVLT